MYVRLTKRQGPTARLLQNELPSFRVLGFAVATTIFQGFRIDLLACNSGCAPECNREGFSVTAIFLPRRRKGFRIDLLACNSGRQICYREGFFSVGLAICYAACQSVCLSVCLCASVSIGLPSVGAPATYCGCSRNVVTIMSFSLS